MKKMIHQGKWLKFPSMNLPYRWGEMSFNYAQVSLGENTSVLRRRHVSNHV